MSWLVRRLVAPRVQSRTYVLESTFTVKATGFSVETALGVAARGREEPGLCPDFLVAIFGDSLCTPVYAQLRSYVCNPWLKSSTISPMVGIEIRRIDWA